MRSSTMCWKGFKLDYYLRLEDMQQWFPCWMHVRLTPSRLPVRSTGHSRVGHELIPLTARTLQQHTCYHTSRLLDGLASSSSHEVL